VFTLTVVRWPLLFLLLAASQAPSHSGLQASWCFLSHGTCMQVILRPTDLNIPASYPDVFPVKITLTSKGPTRCPTFYSLRGHVSLRKQRADIRRCLGFSMGFGFTRRLLVRNRKGEKASTPYSEMDGSWAWTREPCRVRSSSMAFFAGNAEMEQVYRYPFSALTSIANCYACYQLHNDVCKAKVVDLWSIMHPHQRLQNGWVYFAKPNYCRWTMILNWSASLWRENAIFSLIIGSVPATSWTGELLSTTVSVSLPFSHPVEPTSADGHFRSTFGCMSGIGYLQGYMNRHFRARLE